MKNEYDERQQFVRYKGYTSAYAITLCLLILLVFNDYFKISFSNSAMLSVLLFVPVIFVMPYLIIKDAYYGLSESKGVLVYSFIFTCVGLVQLYLFFGHENYQKLIIDHQFTDELQNLLLAISALVIGFFSGYKYLKNHQAE